MLSRPRGKVLVVDDDETIRLIVAAILEDQGHTVTRAANGDEALIVARLGWPEVIITDVVMPVMDGFELVARLKADPATAPIPVIVMTSLEDCGARQRALESGAEDFVAKPVDATELAVRVGNFLRLVDYTSQLRDANRILERELRQRTDALNGANLEAIFSLCRAMEYKDSCTGAHLQRISQYSRVLAGAAGMNADFIECLTMATPMHDIGKIGVPDAVLLKPGPLDDAEWELMRAHTEIGARLLGGAASPYLKMGAEIALCHHENWNGSGYPRGLAGNDIPVSARIMAICDRYDALRAQRPYKRSFSHEEAMRILLEGDERSDPAQVDPSLLELFRRNAKRFDEIFTRYTQTADDS